MNKKIIAIQKIALLGSLFLFAGCTTMKQEAGEEKAMDMYYIVESQKTFDQATEDLKVAVKENGFGVLHIHDLGATLRSKGVDFAEECRVFEVCNPVQAGRVMSTDIQLNMALPCRISVYTENGKTQVGMIKPGAMLSSLSSNPTLGEIATEVESKTMAMIQQAAE